MAKAHSKMDIATVSNLKTVSRLLDRRRARTASGALLELSMLANERERLQCELNRAEWRRQQIHKRLTEIADKEALLQASVHHLFTGTAGASELAAMPVAAPGTQPGSVTLRELTY